MAETTTTVDQDSAGTGATQADVAAAARAAAAAAQTAAAQAAQTAATQATSANAQTQAETVVDVSQGEAYIVNMKRLVAQELNLDAQLLGLAAETSRASVKAAQFNSERIMTQALDFDKSLQNQSIQIIQGAIERTNRLLSNAISMDGRQQGNDEQTDKYEDIMKAIISSMVSGEWFKGNAAERMAAFASAASAAAGAGANATGQAPKA